MVGILSPNRPRPNLGLRSSADSESLEERKQQHRQQKTTTVQPKKYEWWFQEFKEFQFIVVQCQKNVTNEIGMGQFYLMNRIRTYIGVA